ncbi:SDR family oxidoreductase [Gordonia sp. TBRC 11910]|uniref:3-oxoacyl-[acyl-carrier-protein] reductase MabA n=1 Tax=Gordonia asplenii TaxID=2725283 RepID=A0A848KYP8_9ACTN|nr:SDR family oxidoreductase [Gordonia asplenii]NMO03820.1 SDR family oxidoreductase [Gordonia asplenii]
MERTLEGKIAIITGSGHGIGLSIAKLFASHGAKVMIATLDQASGQSAAKSIRDSGGEAELFVLDVGIPDAVMAMVEHTVECFGGVDIVVHNAASFLFGAVDKFVEQDFDTVIDVNLKACFALTKACVPHLKKRRNGRILVTSSVTGPRRAMPGLAYYAASKSAVNGFIRTAALELGGKNITVNGVEPGYIVTRAHEQVEAVVGTGEIEKYIPAGRLGEPEEVAHAMLFLAGENAGYITGQTIVVDGGACLPETPLFANIAKLLDEHV